MTLPASGQISMSDVNDELRLSSSAQCDLLWTLRFSWRFDGNSIGRWEYGIRGDASTWSLNDLRSRYRVTTARINTLVGVTATNYLALGNCDCNCDCGNT